MNNPHGTDQVKFFLGKEVEHTHAHGLNTLFVVGLQPVGNILALAVQHKVDHVYFGANESFQPWSLGEIEKWAATIEEVAKTFLSTWDIPSQYLRLVLSCKRAGPLVQQHSGVIPFVAVKGILALRDNPRACFRFDDLDFGVGEGSHSQPLKDLLKEKQWTTPWAAYQNDESVNHN